jgi:hypothetical protein
MNKKNIEKCFTNRHRPEGMILQDVNGGTALRIAGILTGMIARTFQNSRVLMRERALFFYRHLHTINGISSQNRHIELSFCIADKISHDFLLSSPSQFVIHSEIFAV